jgi:hypothetical protein
MFIVEDGDGIEDANAYVDSGFIEEYFMGNRLAQFQSLSQQEKEAAIITATQLVDISYDWKGTRRSLEQGLNWPRDGVDVEGFTVDGIPSALKKATCEAVWIAMNNEGDSLYRDDNQREVVKESVAGAVAVEYAKASDMGRDAVSRYEILDLLVKHLIRNTAAAANGPSLYSVPVERV